MASISFDRIMKGVSLGSLLLFTVLWAFRLAI